MNVWKRYSYVALGVVTVGCVWTIGVEMSHTAHEHHAPKYPYLKIQSKAFPWENGKCGFFELDCHKRYNDLKKGISHAAHH